MIANLSRISAFQECRKKALNSDILRLVPQREEHALLIGSGTHAGIATILGKRDLAQAKKDAEEEYRKRLPQDMLPEEIIEHEHNIALTNAMVEKFWVRFNQEPYTVIHPEVEFMIPLPNTLHHCWFAHKMMQEAGLTDREYHECAGNMITNFPHAPNDEKEGWKNEYPCIMPHYFRGKTDAVIMLRGLIWLMEHKTTSLAYSLYVRQFQLAAQPTGYIYGIWKSMGLLPNGFILTVLTKPNKQQARSNPFGVTVDTEPFLRTEEDLTRFEREFIQQCDDYERAVRTNTMYMNTHSCFNWNRACYYLELCKNHGEAYEGEFVQREDDYVVKAYRQLLHIPEPEVACNPTNEQ